MGQDRGKSGLNLLRWNSITALLIRKYITGFCTKFTGFSLQENIPPRETQTEQNTHRLSNQQSSAKPPSKRFSLNITIIE